ncbi:LppU/SCO3897 family protein [Kitasatospora terrestris]|uniref:Serine/threonine protein kinase n=1 Tax=Kitasatospora terrestris TaxID=258051 RepID=A0ABP9DST1_9ACTN
MTTPPSQSPAPAEGQAASPYPEIPVEATAPAKTKGKVGKLLLRFVGIVAVAVVAVLGTAVYNWLTDDPAIAEAGNCVHNSGTDAKPSVKVVDCGAADAEFKVLKRISYDDKNGCDNVEDVVASYVVTGRESYTLCLGDNKK